MLKCVKVVYIYLLNVPSFSIRYFNKIKRTSRLGRLHALSLEILSHFWMYIVVIYGQKLLFTVQLMRYHNTKYHSVYLKIYLPK